MTPIIHTLLFRNQTQNSSVTQLRQSYFSIYSLHLSKDFLHLAQRASFHAYYNILSFFYSQATQFSAISGHPCNSVLAGCLSNEDTGNKLMVKGQDCKVGAEK
jgi:hypothetical protein